TAPAPGPLRPGEAATSPPRPRQVLLPHGVDVGHDAVGAGEHEPRRVRLAPEVHARLLGRAVALARVARLAAGHDVLPRGGPAAAARHDVVEGQVVRVPAAVLADVVVAPEDVLAVEGDALAEGRPHEALQPDHAGDGEDRVRRPEDLAGLLDALGDLVHQQRHGALHGADVQGLVAGVEDQNAA